VYCGAESSGSAIDDNDGVDAVGLARAAVILDRDARAGGVFS
jgi:hypothetical protein